MRARAQHAPNSDVDLSDRSSTFAPRPFGEPQARAQAAFPGATPAAFPATVSRKVPFAEEEGSTLFDRYLQLRQATKHGPPPGSQVPAEAPVQREISVGTGNTAASYTANQALRQVIERDATLKPNIGELAKSVLPQYDRDDEPFDSWDQLLERLYSVLPVMQLVWNLDRYGTSLASFIESQRYAQTQVKSNARPYIALMTTVGFEHEFADMKDSPLAGVSHLEIARSDESMPLTGIKFIVETDAYNALELVSPPFLMPTVKGIPLPDPEKVKHVDTLIKSTLYNLLTEPWKVSLLGGYYSRSYVEQTLTQILAKLDTATGLRFQLIANLEIKPEYLSHNTDLDALAQQLDVTGGNQPKLKLKPGVLGDIKAGKSEKSSDSSYSISSQVNFATDLSTIALLQQEPGIREASVFRAVQNGLRDHLPAPQGGSPGLDRLYAQMLQKLAGLFAVYSQEHLRTRQAEWQRDLLVKSTLGPTDRNVGALDRDQKKEFNLHSLLSSYVKDVTPVWVKDHLMSLAKGALLPTDYPRLLETLRNATPGSFDAPESVADLADKGHSDVAGHWQDFIRRLKDSLLLLRGTVLARIRLNRDLVTTDFPPRVSGLYETDTSKVGARQDTYLDPRNVQQDDLWDRRLHVVEIRRGDPAEPLETAASKV